MSFIESCHLLNNSETYPKLMERSKSIGFEITKIVFRGYFASPKLQEMHDNSIQARTNLKLQVLINLNNISTVYIVDIVFFCLSSSQKYKIKNSWWLI